MKKALCHLLLLGLFVTLISSAEEKQVSDPVLDEKLKEAEEIQELREEAGPVTAKLIKEAPEAALNAGTGDISTIGAPDWG
jgi:hypothetical protein